MKNINITIADFLGYVEGFPHETDGYGYHQCVEGYHIPERENLNAHKEDRTSHEFSVDQMCFHSSWDWLMSTRKEINGQIGIFMNCNGYDKLWLEKSKEIETAILTEDTPLKAATLIANLIEWYNQQ